MEFRFCDTIGLLYFEKKITVTQNVKITVTLIINPITNETQFINKLGECVTVNIKI